MRLYFVRHADALPGKHDAARPLSERGQEQARRLGRYFKSLGIEFDAAYTSPLVRACETASLILKKCRLAKGAKLIVTEAMLNETAQADFTQWLSQLPGAAQVLMVGHAPSVNERVARLLGASDLEAMTLRKGAVACLDSEDGQRGQLIFFIPPKCLPLPLGS